MYDGYYQKTGYASTIAFTLNAILSFIVVYDNYLDSKTITVFLTNILLMGLKVADVFSTVNSKKNVFYSAYLKNKVQYNDVDPDKIMMDTEAESKVEELPDIVIDETSESSGKSDLSETNETTPFKESDVSKNTPEMNTQSETNSSDEPLISAASNDIFESSQPKEEELADNSV